ncbi:hypothetical protein [Pandoraea oxalativorans]|uniref:Uncharacterized protein n=1 Tax=Pandoraea oxalativorans TaxID=573737 RepID=A0A192B120_9BURK|nr:hypothetical protein [Pandoraea oxalativorans]ANJ86803.1 hypothetical protein MB84_28510 [Pandoraea oxalativorans]
MPLRQKSGLQTPAREGPARRVEAPDANIKRQWKSRHRALVRVGKTGECLARDPREQAAALHYFTRAIDRNDAPETANPKR